jgi:hypothetical protein
VSDAVLEDGVTAAGVADFGGVRMPFPDLLGEGGTDALDASADGFAIVAVAIVCVSVRDGEA